MLSPPGAPELAFFCAGGFKLISVLIASDGFILQEFVRLLSGFIAVSLYSLLCSKGGNVPWEITATFV